MRRRSNNPDESRPRTIRLAKPGAVRVGPFRRGQNYQVGETVEGTLLTAELADRLVAVKGFVDIEAAAEPMTETAGDAPANQNTEDTQEG